MPLHMLLSAQLPVPPWACDSSGGKETGGGNTRRASADHSIFPVRKAPVSPASRQETLFLVTLVRRAMRCLSLKARGLYTKSDGRAGIGRRTVDDEMEDFCPNIVEKYHKY